MMGTLSRIQIPIFQSQSFKINWELSFVMLNQNQQNLSHILCGFSLSCKIFTEEILLDHYGQKRHH